MEVDHSGPIGVRSLCSCWAALVYGNGKSLSMYLAAFLSLRSLMITWLSLASLRWEASTPSIFLTNLRAFFDFFAPLPAQAPCK